MQNISIEAAKAKGFKQRKIDEYCNSVKEAKEKSLEK